MQLPNTIYFATVDYGRTGIGIPDFWPTPWDAYVHCVEGEDRPFRMFRMDFDVGTNAFESASEITEDFWTDHGAKIQNLFGVAAQ